MERRDFLKTTSTVIAGATLAPGVLATNPAHPAGAAPEGRLVIPINRNWRYSKSVVEGAHRKEFDDSKLRPRRDSSHQCRLPWHSFDDKAMNSSPSTAAASGFRPRPGASASSWISKGP